MKLLAEFPDSLVFTSAGITRLSNQQLSADGGAELIWQCMETGVNGRKRKEINKKGRYYYYFVTTCDTPAPHAPPIEDAIQYNKRHKMRATNGNVV